MPNATTDSLTFPSDTPDTPDAAPDLLQQILHQGARQMLIQAVEAEIDQWLSDRSHLVDQRGHRLVVRNGHAAPRTVVTGVGPVQLRMPRAHDRRDPTAGRERFSSKILPPYLRKARSIEELIPWLYLKGVSTGDFTEALQALLGPSCPGLSASTVTRLVAQWQEEQAAWARRDLSDKHYVYVWADGIHFNIRLEEDRQCILVMVMRKRRGTTVRTGMGATWIQE